jgi:hypothetical protein
VIGGALRLGAATGIGYAVGGTLGVSVLKAVKSDASADTITAAAWSGRVVVFFIAAAVLTRI